MDWSWIRGILPGIFAESYHWRERALQAEARLSQVIDSYSTVIAHERELHEAERRELLQYLVVDSAKPPQPGEGVEGGMLSSALSLHPIQQAIESAKKARVENYVAALPDDEVERLRDEYLRTRAIN